MASETDRIEKTALLPAGRSRVWRALTDSAQFGAWFGIGMEDQFTPGAPARGRITSAGYEGVSLVVWVEKIEPERYFSFRWHPYAIDPKIDYSSEPTTLIEFTLEDAPGGTKLTVVESGFDRIPAHRRAEAFKMNTGGWASQLVRIAKYLAAEPAASS